MSTTTKKNIGFFLLLLIVMILPSQAQKKQKGKRPVDFTITQSKTIKANGKQLVLKQVISDGRCPQGTDCFWPGEAQVLISIYQNRKWMDEEIITFSSKKLEDNKAWLSRTLSIPISKIKNISLIPYPKDSLKIDPKSYAIKVEIGK